MAIAAGEVVAETQVVKMSPRPSFPNLTSPLAIQAAPWGASNPDQYLEAKEEAARYALSHGFGPESFCELPVVWAEQMGGHHVNHVVFFKWLEEARMLWWDRMTVKSGMKGKVSFVIGEINLQYKRSLSARDTLLIAHRVKSVHNRMFMAESLIYSYNQRAMIATGPIRMHVMSLPSFDSKSPIPEPFRDLLQGMLDREPAKL